VNAIHRELVDFESKLQFIDTGRVTRRPPAASLNFLIGGGTSALLVRFSLPPCLPIVTDIGDESSGIAVPASAVAIAETKKKEVDADIISEKRWPASPIVVPIEAKMEFSAMIQNPTVLCF
jgi:hypothetical protein